MLSKAFDIDAPSCPTTPTLWEITFTLFDTFLTIAKPPVIPRISIDAIIYKSNLLVLRTLFEKLCLFIKYNENPHIYFTVSCTTSVIIGNASGIRITVNI